MSQQPVLVVEQDVQSVVEAEQSSNLHLKDNNKVLVHVSSVIIMVRVVLRRTVVGD